MLHCRFPRPVAAVGETVDWAKLRATAQNHVRKLNAMYSGGVAKTRGEKKASGGGVGPWYTFRRLALLRASSLASVARRGSSTLRPSPRAEALRRAPQQLTPLVCPHDTTSCVAQAEGSPADLISESGGVVYINALASVARVEGEGAKVISFTGSDGQPQEVSAQHLIVAVGGRPRVRYVPLLSGHAGTQGVLWHRTAADVVSRLHQQDSRNRRCSGLLSAVVVVARAVAALCCC